MIEINRVKYEEKHTIDTIVDIHMKTFKDFFLTFMGRGFLRQMYYSYCDYDKADLLVAEKFGEVVGFLAYSSDFSGLYKHMIRKRLISFTWYSMGAFFRKPTSFTHIIKAFLKPKEVMRKEKYVELSSIGVKPEIKSCGVGTELISALKQIVDFNEYQYISLETDAVNNDASIRFYEKNGFIRERIYETDEGRKMIEYRFSR